jgi:hypothetical protein
MYSCAFWGIAPCSLIELEQHFRGTYCLCHQGDVTQKAVVSTTRKVAEIMNGVVWTYYALMKVELLCEHET